MNSLRFENIFKKYNICCEASKKTKSQKSNEQKGARNKNHSCINLGRANDAANEAHNRINFSLSSYRNFSNSAKELKTKKKCESIKAKRRYKPLDLIITKRIATNCTNTTLSQESSALLTGKCINDVSSSNDLKYMNLINPDVDKTTTIDESYLKTQNPILSSSSYYQEKGNSSYLWQSNSLELKKTKRNSTPKYLYRHRQLQMVNITAIKQPSEELLVSTFQRQLNGNNKLEISNSLTTSSLKNTRNESVHPIPKNFPKTFQIVDTPTTSSQQAIDRTNELGLLIDLKKNENRKISERTKSTNFHEKSYSSTTSLLEIDESLNSSLRNSPKTSQIIDTPSTSQQSINQPTELDLLIELIENDNKKKAERNKQNDKEISISKKPCQKGGIEEHFVRVVNRNKIGGRYLKHDKKYGLKTGILSKIVKLETAYGVNIATMQCIQNNMEFCTVIAPEMVAQIKIGSLIESFFDDTCDPYSLQTNGKKLDLFLQPYKLLVL